MSSTQPWSNRFLSGIFAGVIVACLLAYLAWWLLHVTDWGEHYSNAGAFGDAFGPVTGLLSSLALAAAVVSVFMQRAELQAQREELALTREELAKQREAAEDQVEAQRELTKAQDEANALSGKQLDLAASQLAQARIEYEWETNKHTRDAARELLLAKAQALHAQASAAAAQITANNTLGRDIDAASKTIDQLQGTIVMTLQELDRLLKQTNQ